MKKIYVFGDSIAFGELVSSNKNWPSLLSKFYDDKGDRILVQNFSQNGDTTRLALNRIGFDILNRNPEISIIQFGLNDCNRWKSENFMNRVNIISFENNLIEICLKIEKSGGKKFFLNTNHLTLKSAEFDYQSDALLYNESIRKAYFYLKNKIDIELIDMEREFKSEVEKNQNFTKKCLMKDGIHLNEKGQDFYFKTILKKLNNIIT